MKALLLSAAAALALPSIAGATTISAGTGGNFGALAPGASYSITYDPDEELTFDFGLSGTGLMADLAMVTYTINGVTYTYDTLSSLSASGEADEFTTASSFDVVVALASTAASTIYFTYTYTAYASEVPLPAGIILLGTALAGGSVVALRRKKSEKAEA